MSKPDFVQMWANFPTHPAYPTLKDLFTHIGGQLADNIDVPSFGPNGNTCAVRMSMALNHGSAPISKGVTKALGLSVLTGADKKLYLFRVRGLKTYLAKVLGVAVVDKKAPFGDTFAKKRGIVTMDVSGWGNASGHVAIWSGKDFHEPAFDNDPKTTAREATTTQASLWVL
jgi:Type VI secretion system (T6SS), amidase effector protein 4